MYLNFFTLIFILIHILHGEKVGECGIDSDKTCNDIEMKNVVDSESTKSYHNLKSTVAEIKQKCGQVCDTNLESDIKGKYYDQLWKNIDCQAMFKYSIFDGKSQFHKPPSENLLPQSVKDEFTYQRKLQMEELYADNTKGI